MSKRTPLSVQQSHSKFIGANGAEKARWLSMSLESLREQALHSSQKSVLNNDLFLRGLSLDGRGTL